MIEYDRIFSWLENVEGAMTCRGYIPCFKASGGTANYYGTQSVTDYRAMGVSGVTIGVGVDLGQQKERNLRKWGVPEAVLDKIRPYIGLQSGAALRALRNNPLTLSLDETQALTRAEHYGYLSSVVIPWWNKGEREKDFDNLPWQAQAVIFSLLYQCGVKGAERCGPNTIRYLRAGNYARAAACLMDKTGWNGEYVNRRYMEGKLLREAV